MSKPNRQSGPLESPAVVLLQHCRVEIGRQTLLDDLNWEVRPGQHWAVLGGNGSGKTTLLSLVSGYLWPASGAATVLGHRFGQVDLRELRKRMGLVSTAIADRFRGTRPHEEVGQVVLSGAFASVGVYQQPLASQRDLAAHQLQRMGIAHLASRPWGTLSTGEQQRALVARALMAEPDLLLLDEPCAGLDLKGREEFLYYLEQATTRQGAPCLTTLYVTHYPEEILPCFTHVLLLRDGRSLAQGPKHTVLTPPILSAALELSVEVTWSAERPWVHPTGSPQLPERS